MNAKTLYLMLVATYDWTRIEKSFSITQDLREASDLEEKHAHMLLPSLVQLADLLGEPLAALRDRFNSPKSSLMQDCLLNQSKAAYAAQHMSSQEIHAFAKVLNEDIDLSLLLSYVLVEELLQALGLRLVSDETQSIESLKTLPRWFFAKYVKPHMRTSAAV